jgi:hypothetical protein
LWEVVFDGESAQFKHEKGAEYVARLLKERGPFHALDLVARRGPSSVKSTLEGRRKEAAVLKEVLDVGGTIQERSVGLDERETRQALIEQRRRLEAVAAIAKFLRLEPGRPTDAAQRAVRAVRMAIKRLHRNLAAAASESGRSDRVLAAFAEHLEKHLLIPSARYSGARAREARGEMAGCFVYERPAGAQWKIGEGR